MFFSKIYSIVLNVGNENKQMCVLPLIPRFIERLEVVFMVEFLLFLIIGFMFSVTINVALLSIIYIILSNKEQ